MAPLESARQVFAEALSAELDIDMSPEFMDAVDVLLARMWLSGVVVAPSPEHEMV